MVAEEGIARLEQDLIAYLESSYNSFRGLRNYAETFGYKDTDEFIANLEGPILDVGSGHNGFAITARLAKLPFQIESVSPRFGSANFLEWQAGDVKRFQRSDFPDATPAEIAAAVAYANAHTHAAVAHKLPFADNMFRRVFDSFAFTTKAKEHQRPLLQATFAEMYRVTAPGGMMMMGGREDMFGSLENSWKEQLVHSMGYQYRYIRDPKDRVIGVRITKPESNSAAR